MIYLLLGGAPSVGKTQAIHRLAYYLMNNKNFIDVHGLVPPQNLANDFFAILEGVNSMSNKMRIILNSPSDTPELIQKFKNYYDSNGAYDLVVSSIRDNNFWPRSDFFNIMKISQTDTILEFPLGKITRRGANFQMAYAWYILQVDRMIQYLLSKDPFYI